MICYEILLSITAVKHYAIRHINKYRVIKYSATYHVIKCHVINYLLLENITSSSTMLLSITRVIQCLLWIFKLGFFITRFCINKASTTSYSISWSSNRELQPKFNLKLNQIINQLSNQTTFCTNVLNLVILPQEKWWRQFSQLFPIQGKVDQPDPRCQSKPSWPWLQWRSSAQDHAASNRNTK